jgi:hypothetical protein
MRPSPRDVRFSRQQEQAHQVDGVEDWHDGQPGESDRPDACLGLPLGTAVGLLGLRDPFHNTHEEMRARWQRGALLRANSVVPDRILLDRCVRVDGHGAGGGRN